MFITVTEGRSRRRIMLAQIASWAPRGRKVRIQDDGTDVLEDAPGSRIELTPQWPQSNMTVVCSETPEEVDDLVRDAIADAAAIEEEGRTYGNRLRLTPNGAAALERVAG